MDRLLTVMKAFVVSAEAGSFSIAARRMEISTSTVSTMISRLEEHLGVRLLNRTTRRMNLTDEGKVYLERCRQILADIEDAENLMARNRNETTGHIKVDVPTAFGRQCLVPALPAFTSKHPNVKITLLLTDRQSDLLKAGVDIALRPGDLDNSTFMARRVHTARFIACASPAFLKKYRSPRHPKDLESMRCLGFIYPFTDRVLSWTFIRDGVTHHHEPSGHLNMNSADALIEAAKCGEGIIYSYDVSVRQAIAAGELVPILEDWDTERTPLSLVYPQTKLIPPRIKAFSDFIAGLFPSANSSVVPIGLGSGHPHTARR